MRINWKLDAKERVTTATIFGYELVVWRRDDNDYAYRASFNGGTMELESTGAGFFLEDQAKFAALVSVEHLEEQRGLILEASIEEAIDDLGIEDDYEQEAPN